MARKVEEDEIDLIELSRVVWSKRKFILKVTSGFFILGIIIAFTSKVEYEATCKLLPESQEGSIPDFGGLSGLAGLAGLDLRGLEPGGGALAPELYPEMVKSTPFVVDLIHTPIYFEKLDTTISSFQYFDEIDKPSLIGYLSSYTIGLPGRLKSLFSKTNEEEYLSEKNEEWVRFTKNQWALIEDYADRLEVSVENETGIVLIETKMPDPIAVAQITNHLVNNLTKKITDYSIEKEKMNLEFISEQFLKAEEEYRIKQEEVARFVDRNRNMTSSLIQADYKRLNNEMNIIFEVYKGLAAQLEQAKISVKKVTPVFTVLEPVKVPVERSNPRRLLLINLFSFIGAFFSIFMILFRVYLTK